VEDDVRAARERRRGIAAHRDQRDAEAPHDRDETVHLGLAAVRHREQHVAAHERAEVAVAALHRMEDERRRAGRRERRGGLSADDAGLADATDDDLPAAREEDPDGAGEAPAEPPRDGAERTRLDVEHAPGAIEPRLAHRRASRSARSIATTSASSPGSSASGTLVAPSESARLGSSCTSRNSASTPAPTAARASGATKRRSPPDAVPSPPGC